METEIEEKRIYIANILVDLNFKEEIVWERSLTDKLFGKKGIPSYWLVKGSLRMNTITLVWYNNGKNIGQIFNHFVKKQSNVINLINQMIRENKLLKILENEN